MKWPSKLCVWAGKSLMRPASCILAEMLRMLLLLRAPSPTSENANRYAMQMKVAWRLSAR